MRLLALLQVEQEIRDERAGKGKRRPPGTKQTPEERQATEAALRALADRAKRKGG